LTDIGAREKKKCTKEFQRIIIMKKKLRNKAARLTTGFTAVSHKIRSSAQILLVILILFMFYGCCKSTSPDEEPTSTIEILQNGVIQETFIVTEENDGDIYPVYYSKSQIGEIEVEYVERYSNSNPHLDPTIYFFTMGRKNQSYSLFNYVESFDTLRIDYQQDFDEIDENLNCGTMYDPYDGYVKNARFSVWLDSVFVDSLFTDSLGRFETIIEPDSFSLKTSMPDIPAIEFVLLEGYADYFVPYYYVYVDKPNIYLYPENTIELDVSIEFPQTGEVVTSIPQYPEKWKNITVEPDGTINGQYRYLFYESKQPNFVQRKNGWIVECDNLEDFFRSNMKESGFIQPEIDDFIEYWIPILKDSPCFAIYPQYNEQLEPLIQLNFSKQPDSILRLVYVIEKLDCAENKFEEPEILPFERAGFVVAEWGVVFER